MRFHRALGPGMASPVTSRVSYMVGLRPHTTWAPQKVAFWKGNPLILGNSRLVKCYNLARMMMFPFEHSRAILV